MKKLVVGLGNIGSDYVQTRHNIGFDVVDHLADKHQASFSTERFGELAQIRLKNKQLYVLKPNTYMNRSGKAVSHWLQALRITTEDCVVVVDDLHLDFGSIRLRRKGSAAGHNGISDIIDTLGHQDFARIKFGLGNDFPKGRQVDFVLGRWTEEEQILLPQLKSHATSIIESLFLSGLENTMSQYNK